MKSKKRRPTFTIEAMKGVVVHYRAFRPQPADPVCPACKYILFADVEDASVTPEGFEEMREANAFIQQCEEHNVALYPWLWKTNLNKAARWLVKRGNKSPGTLLPSEKFFEEWKKAVYVEST